jgi:hypothetical protein
MEKQARVNFARRLQTSALSSNLARCPQRVISRPPDRRFECRLWGQKRTSSLPIRPIIGSNRPALAAEASHRADRDYCFCLGPIVIRPALCSCPTQSASSFTSRGGLPCSIMKNWTRRRRCVKSVSSAAGRILASTKGAGRNRRPLLRNVRKRRCGYGFFSAHALVAASHVPPAFVQSASVFAAAAPAKAGPVKASARVIANIEMRIFMAFSPLRWTKPQYLNALFETYVPGTPDPIAG